MQDERDERVQGMVGWLWELARRAAGDVEARARREADHFALQLSNRVLLVVLRSERAAHDRTKLRLEEAESLLETAKSRFEVAEARLAASRDECESLKTDLNRARRAGA